MCPPFYNLDFHYILIFSIVNSCFLFYSVLIFRLQPPYNRQYDQSLSILSSLLSAPELLSSKPEKSPH